jgi:hypothetical protein
MNRRQFFTRAAVAAAALVVDPERLLWVPGAKAFFLPPPKGPIVSGAQAEQAFKEIAAKPFAEIIRGDHEVWTGVGHCVFDQDWNLLSVRGKPVTALEAARLQLGHYQQALIPRDGSVCPEHIRQLAVEIEARRALTKAQGSR